MTPRKQATWGSIHPRGSGFQLSYYGPKQPGEKRRKQIREQVATREEAERLRARRFAEVTAADEGRAAFISPDQRRIAVNAFLDAVEADWKVRKVRSLKSSLSHMAPVRRLLGAAKVTAVDASGWQVYVACRREEGVSDTTIDKEREVLSHAFQLAYRDRRFGWTLHLPRLVPLRANRRETTLGPEQVRAVLGGITSHGFRDALEWFAVTGWRPREIGTLSWEDYDRAQRILRIRPENAKTGRARFVPIVPPLTAILARREKVRRLDVPLIFHVDGQSLLCKRDRGGFRDVLEREWKRAVREAQAAEPKAWRDMPERIIPYDLRRSANLLLALAGVDEVTRALILGHSAAMNVTYTSSEAMVRALEKRTNTSRTPKSGTE